MLTYLYLILSLLYVGCSPQESQNGGESAQPVAPVQPNPHSDRTTPEAPPYQQQPNPPLPQNLPNPNNTNCTKIVEITERLAGKFFSNDCQEVAKASDSLKDFFNAPLGIEIPSLSTNEFAVFRTKGGQSRIDMTLMPKKADGKFYANFEEFYQASLLGGDRLQATFKRIASVADGLGLNTHGYRLVIDEIPASGHSFSWRLFGGEPLGDTVQVAGQHRRSHGPNVDINANYSPAHNFRSYVDESFVGPGFKVHSLGSDKAMTFKDLSPQAAVHILAIPKGPYVSSYDFAKKASPGEIQVLLKGIHQIIADNQTVGSGSFRFITNAGRDANQSQPHLHFHVVRGDSLRLGHEATAKIPHRIMKTYNINEIIGHIDDDTLVVFDIDATLAWVPGHTWPYEEVPARSLAEGPKTLTMWQSLLAATSNVGTHKGAKFIGLTARPLPTNPQDEAQVDLAAVGLKASYSWIQAIKPGPNYRTGVLYANHSDKGSVLKQFLAAAQAHYGFKKVIFIDDRLNNSTDVYNALKAGIPGIEASISFWYQGAIHPKTNATIGWILWPLRRTLGAEGVIAFLFENCELPSVRIPISRTQHYTLPYFCRLARYSSINQIAL